MYHQSAAEFGLKPGGLWRHNVAGVGNVEKKKKEELKNRILNKEDTFNEMVDKTFHDADLNKNNFIERDELATLLKSIYATIGLPPPSKSDVDLELKRLDKNKDKKISKEEFRILVKDLCLFFIDQSS